MDELVKARAIVSITRDCNVAVKYGKMTEVRKDELISAIRSVVETGKDEALSHSSQVKNKSAVFKNKAAI